MIKRIRNNGCIPDLSTEGKMIKPIQLLKVLQKGTVCSGSSPFDRLFDHHTLASARRYTHFEPFSDLVPKDSLDFILTSTYDHATEVFPVKVDSYLQQETSGVSTWRRLRNTEDLPPDRDTREPDFSFFDLLEGGLLLNRYSRWHPVLIGGVKERKHFDHVKLMNSSHHSPQTNAGYTRQDRDGTTFKY
ncbi:hypothetical protein FQA39_LY18077 [Lamprigera yunnana]|nr:hypothetical protein FQA39_LY18077 [Lamprigera yunnana]